MLTGMSIFEHPVNTLGGEPSSLAKFEGAPTLIVNVASQCGLTPQYTGLEQLQKEYGDRGFNVVGFPCNQFGAQEPGSAEEIATFCSMNYGVTFPMMEKVEVNGDNRHPIYAELTEVADAEGHTGDIRWNFEKFLVGRDGSITRFSPMVTPEDAALVGAIEPSSTDPNAMSSPRTRARIAHRISSGRFDRRLDPAGERGSVLARSAQRQAGGAACRSRELRTCCGS